MSKEMSEMQKMIEQFQKMNVVQPPNNIQNENLIIQNNQQQPIVINSIPNEHKYSWIKTHTDTKLNVTSNDIGSNPDDPKYLADAIRTNTSIKKLYLDHNKIGYNPDDLKYLTDAIKNSISITE